MRIEIDELKEICRLTVQLTELRQNECKHLCIENFAPDLFSSLIDKFGEHKQLTDTTVTISGA